MAAHAGGRHVTDVIGWGEVFTCDQMGVEWKRIEEGRQGVKKDVRMS